jgi:hypothetical protein
MAAMSDSRWRGRGARRLLEGRLIPAPRWHPPFAKRHCTVHLAVPAVDRCDRCGQPFCADCLQFVARWRVCSACRARLERDHAGLSLISRWRALIPSLLAIGVIGLVITGGVVAINLFSKGMAGTATPDLVGTTEQVSCREHYPDPTKLYVVGGLPLFGYPPSRLTFENCHFQPDETARAVGGIFGYDEHGQRLGEDLGPAVAHASKGGVLTVSLDIPDHTRFQGSYEIRATVIGHEGSEGTASLSAEGNLVQPTAGPSG